MRDIKQSFDLYDTIIYYKIREVSPLTASRLMPDIHWKPVKIDRQVFEAYVDSQNGRVWTMDHFDGTATTSHDGMMTWSEYYAMNGDAVTNDISSYLKSIGHVHS